MSSQSLASLSSSSGATPNGGTGLPSSPTHSSMVSPGVIVRAQTKKLSDFSGKPTEDVEEWADHFQLVRAANGWDAAYCLSVLPACLLGAALQWWKREGQLLRDQNVASAAVGSNGLDVVLSEVLRGLVQRFIDPAKEENARVVLRSRTQRKGETVREYLSAMEALFIRANIGTNAEMQRYFEDGLRQDIKAEVLRSPSFSLHDAFNKACRFETVQARLATSSIQPSRPSSVSRIAFGVHGEEDETEAKRIGAVHTSGQKQQDNGSSQGGSNSGGRGRSRGGRGGRQSDTNRGTFDGVCYNCGKNGHMSKDCWSKKSNGNSSGRGGHARGGGRTRKCYICFEPSHIVEDCPFNSRRNPSISASSRACE